MEMLAAGNRSRGVTAFDRGSLILLTACRLLLTAACFVAFAPAVEGSEPRRPAARLTPPYFLTSAPEMQGMDSELLAQAVDHFLAPENRNLYNIHSMTVVRNGHVVADVSFFPFQLRSRHELASTSKVFLTTLVGIAVDEGHIGSIDDRVIDYFPDRTIANLDSWKQALTIEHLLTMTSGLGFDDEAETDAMTDTDDWVQHALDLPMSHEPGTWWNYHQPTAFLLSAVISRSTGMNLVNFAREKLFAPLGFRDPFWFASPNGRNPGYTGLHIPPHDLAKFGQLILQRGKWNGRQIISQAWVETATSVQWPPFYGYMWHIYSERPGVSVGGGAAGQRIVVSPERDLVVAFLGGGHAHTDVERIYLEALDSMIFPSIQADGPLPANPAGVAQLADAIRRAASDDSVPVPAAPVPAVAQSASGRTFTMDENPAEVLTVTPTFVGDDELRLRVTATGNESPHDFWVWTFGLDGGGRYAYGEFGIPAYGTGEWLDDHTLELMVDTLGMLTVLRITVAFLDEGRRLTVTVEDQDRFEPDPTWTVSGTALD